MFNLFRRQRQERDEFLTILDSKVAAIHEDLIRRDEELISALTTLTDTTHQVSERLETEASLADVLRQLVTTRDNRSIDLTKERVLGGSVSVGRGELDAPR
jgi:hypothetical protein